MQDFNELQQAKAVCLKDIPNGTLTFDELLEEAMDGKSVEPSIAKACVTEFMKAVKRNVLKGFRCQLGDRSASR